MDSPRVAIHSCIGGSQEDTHKGPLLVQGTKRPAIRATDPVRIQWIDATASANASDGDTKPRVLRGRPLSPVAFLREQAIASAHVAGPALCPQQRTPDNSRGARNLRRRRVLRVRFKKLVDESLHSDSVEGPFLVFPIRTSRTDHHLDVVIG